VCCTAVRQKSLCGLSAGRMRETWCKCEMQMTFKLIGRFFRDAEQDKSPSVDRSFHVTSTQTELRDISVTAGKEVEHGVTRI
jgi:hypothetical protein